jgi:hypothetical protein
MDTKPLDATYPTLGRNPKKEPDSLGIGGLEGSTLANAGNKKPRALALGFL